MVWEGSSGLPETERGSAQHHSPSLGGKNLQSASLEQSSDSPHQPPKDPATLHTRSGSQGRHGHRLPESHQETPIGTVGFQTLTTQRGQPPREEQQPTQRHPVG